MVRSGLATDGRLLSLACASHSGEDFHVEAAREILAGAGLTEADLQNTPDYPYDESARIGWIASGRPKQSIVQNCSGKHASMLATCVVNGWDLATYRDPAHPLQVAVAETVRELTGAEPSAVAVDGCGAPIHAVPLRALARSFGRLAAATEGPEAKIARAIRDFPEYLGGTHRDVTALIRGVDGLVAKDGAEAVYAVGLPDGRGIAVKVADGTSRARSVLLAAVLRRIGVGSDDVLAVLEHQPVLGHGQPVGVRRRRRRLSRPCEVATRPGRGEVDVRAVLQRVTSARVEVEGEVVGAIDRPGLLALVGVTHDDGPEQVERMARKIAELRILRDEQSLTDAGAPVLVVSQFTLYADTRKGRRPSWRAAAPGPVAEPLVDDLVAALRARGIEVEQGRFGAMMQVSLRNDGPVTLVVDA